MEAIAYKDTLGAIRNLMCNEHYECDSYEWLYDSQGGYKEIYRDEVQHIVDMCTFVYSSDQCIKKEHFTSVSEYLVIDELTYFIACPSIRAYLDKGFSSYSSKESLEYIDSVEGLYIGWIDGWWEIYPKKHKLNSVIRQDVEKATVAIGNNPVFNSTSNK